ncbi:glycine cleavage T C-terminal barrel domain-containing protein [soil metagenome]
MKIEDYKKIRSGAIGYYHQKRGLIEVFGKEAIQFLNGLITNDVAKLDENAQMLAAFPNAQGRLLAVVRVLRKGDKFLFETEAATHEKVFQNLFRFTFAGDFFVEDLSENYEYFSIVNCKLQISDSVEFESNFGQDTFVPKDAAENFQNELLKQNAVKISDALYEVLRIEQGIPLYGVDMDETTIVPEIGLENIVSYNKGCYIGQEIIARIHFRGHIAKQLIGLILMENGKWKIENGSELKSLEGKSAGRLTSVTFSPKLEKTIALAYVRYEFLAEGTELKIGDSIAKVTNLPFIKN